MILTAAASPSPFWFLTRGTGAISLVLLTLTLTLGVNVRRTRFEHVPRFVLDSVHRSASLLAVTFLLVHIFTGPDAHRWRAIVRDLRRGSLSAVRFRRSAAAAELP